MSDTFPPPFEAYLYTHRHFDFFVLTPPLSLPYSLAPP